MKFRLYIVILFVTVVFAGGCVPTRQLGPNQKLLYRIKLQGVEQASTDRITSLYQQRPNRKILGSTPYLSIYNFGKRFYSPQKIEKRINYKRARYDKRIQAAGNDSSKVARLLRKKERRLARLSRHLEEGNAIMSLGEPPAIYDSAKATATAQQIHTYLNSKGFFKNRVTYTAEERNKKITLTYQVTENAPYTYSQITDSIADAGIKAIYDSTRHQAIVKAGQNYDEELLVSERNRLENLFKNLGYFEFRKQYILAEVDTSFEENTVRLRFIITNDNSGEPHRVFRLAQVNFIADASYSRFGLRRDTILYNGIKYLAYVHKISPRILDKKITIRAGQRYSLDRSNSTQRQLTNLDMFRFLNITYLPDSVDITNLTANINASPSKRFQETTESGITYSAQIPGPFANFRLMVRNIFRGAEVLEIGLRGGLEGQFSALDINKSIYSRELGANVALVFPQFLVPFRTNKYFTRYNPRTRLNVGYTDIKRQEFNRTNLETTFDYIWQKSPRLQYVFTPLDVSIIDSNRDKWSQTFKNSLEILRERNNGNPTTYERSFYPSFVSSINFSALYNSNNYNHTLDAAYFRFFIEEAGLLTRSVFGLADSIGDLKLYRYVRLMTDYRRYFKLAPNRFLVGRVNFGIAKSFDRKDPSLPYDKYFFAGGGTSVRAFQPRRLGPGSYLQPALSAPDGDDDPDNNNRIFLEQQGELLMEGNLEYRFNIYGFLNGALFTDVGNIWSLHEDIRPGAKFEANKFYKQFAVGSGFGLRFDFTFLIARLDIATKVYDPSVQKFVLGEWSGKIFNRNYTTFNLGIGYPF